MAIFLLLVTPFTISIELGKLKVNFDNVEAFRATVSARKD